jgi:FAD:protein FMN transferase
MQPVLNAIRAIGTRGAVALVLTTALLVPSRTECHGSTPPSFTHELRGSTMGTTYHIKLVGAAELPLHAVQNEIEATLESINASMSTYRTESELSRINRSTSTDWIEISKPLHTVLTAALKVSHITDGAFDVTVGPLVNLWGFGPTASRERPPTPAAIRAAHQRVGYRQLTLRAQPRALRKARADVYIDLSAIAKGYAVDAVAALLEARRHTDFMVEIGGETTVRGHNGQHKAWQIGLESPLTEPGAVADILLLSNTSVATSGDYRNYFEFGRRRYSHEIDPVSGWPVAHSLTQVSVLHRSTMIADAYATAFMVMGAERGLRCATINGVAARFTIRSTQGLREKNSVAFAADFSAKMLRSHHPSAP